MTTATPADIARSREATLDHIAEVRRLMGLVIDNLQSRAILHDASKLREPELSGFAALQTRLADISYGTPAYRQALAEAREVVSHHYAWNDHHPEFWPLPVSEAIELLRLDLTVLAALPDAESGGTITRTIAYLQQLLRAHESRLNGMSLLSLMEWLVDCSAASQRTKDGTPGKSLSYNVERFGLEPQLANILWNTLVELGWDKRPTTQVE